LAGRTLPCDGWGNPTKPVGLIASMFRPSDDATVFPFLVPSNFFAVVSLRQLSDMVSALFGDSAFANQ
jgi:meiotically up-regulated gene 157 (Mug157) protein